MIFMQDSVFIIFLYENIDFYGFPGVPTLKKHQNLIKSIRKLQKNNISIDVFNVCESSELSEPSVYSVHTVYTIKRARM